MLCKFKDEVNHCDVPSTYKNKRLATWVTRQRTLYNLNDLDKERINKLTNIGFIFDPDEAAWNQKFMELKAFKEIEGHCNVPQKYSKNPKLGSWVAIQRANHRKPNFSQIRINQLSNINFNWQINPASIKIDWESYFLQLCDYYKEYGHSNVPSNYNKNRLLARWVIKQRVKYRKNNLSKDYINILNTLSFDWNPVDKQNDNWNNNFAKLIAYKSLNGHCNVPNNDKNKKLGAWASKQRQKYKKNDLPQERINKLNQLGFNWNPIDEDKENWDKRFDQLAKYKDLHGHCNVPKNYPKNMQLATWVDKHRQKYRKNNLSQDYIDKLNMLSFEWDPKNTFSEKMFSELCAFKAKMGHCNVARNYKQNNQLANWVNTQRALYRNKKLSQEHINQLIKIGFIFEPDKDDWEKMFSELCSYKAANGNCKVPQCYSSNPALGRWVSRQRVSFRKKIKILSKDRIDRLNEIGFIWEFINIKKNKIISWINRFLQLCDFKKEYGHCNVPRNLDNKELAIWASKQRYKYNKGKLAQERIDQLNSIGFIWNLKKGALNEFI